MVRRLRVRNFLCLRDATVDLGPLTILIGPNASGKSAIFKALVMLSRLLGGLAVRGPQGEFTLEPGVTLDHLVWKGDSGLPIILQAWFVDDPDDEPSYTIDLRKEARGWSVYRERIRLETGWFDTGERHLEYPTERRGVVRWQAPNRASLCYLVYPYRNDQAAIPVISPFLEFARRFGSFWRYRPSAPDIASFVKPEPESGRDVYVHVHENGWGLPWVLRELQGKDRDSFQQIARLSSAFVTTARWKPSCRCSTTILESYGGPEPLAPFPGPCNAVMLIECACPWSRDGKPIPTRLGPGSCGGGHAHRPRAASTASRLSDLRRRDDNPGSPVRQSTRKG